MFHVGALARQTGAIATTAKRRGTERNGGGRGGGERQRGGSALFCAPSICSRRTVLQTLGSAALSDPRLSERDGIRKSRTSTSASLASPTEQRARRKSPASTETSCVTSRGVVWWGYAPPQTEARRPIADRTQRAATTHDHAWQKGGRVAVSHNESRTQESGAAATRDPRPAPPRPAPPRPHARARERCLCA